MTAKRILSLDISSKTGWALVISSPSGMILENYGVVPQTHEPKDRPYPMSFVSWAYQCYSKIVELVDLYHPDVLVIEETAANSKSSHSQKILEWIHMLVAKLIGDTGIEYAYLQTGVWRKLINCKMTKNELQHNKEVKKYKLSNKTKIAYDQAGKRIGKITKKHVAIRRANELFSDFLKEPLRCKNEDEADAMCLAAAYHFKRMNYFASNCDKTIIL
jgi:Holliday junction resolvasome RuvABC endonuclease subunit